MTGRRLRVLGLEVAPLESPSRMWPLVASSRSAAYRMRDRGELPMLGGKCNLVALCERLGWQYEIVEAGGDDAE